MLTEIGVNESVLFIFKLLMLEISVAVNAANMAEGTLSAKKGIDIELFDAKMFGSLLRRNSSKFRLAKINPRRHGAE